MFFRKQKNHFMERLIREKKILLSTSFDSSMILTLTYQLILAWTVQYSHPKEAHETHKMIIYLFIYFFHVLNLTTK